MTDPQFPLTVVINADGSFKVTRPLPPPAFVPVKIEAPVIVGTAKVGQPLTVIPATWTNNPTSVNHQWGVDGAAVPAATGPSYTPVVADAGKPVTVTDGAVNAAGKAIPAVSLATAPVLPADVVTPPTKPSWAVGDVALDFVNNQYWDNGAVELSALIGGTAPVVSASGLRCSATDLLKAIGTLKTKLNGASGFLVAKFVSTDKAIGHYPRVLDIAGGSLVACDPTGTGDGSGKPKIVFDPDGQATPAKRVYMTYSVGTDNIVAVSWDSIGFTQAVDGISAVVPAPRVLNSNDPFLGNNAANTRPLMGFLEYLAVGSTRPPDAALTTLTVVPVPPPPPPPPVPADIPVPPDAPPPVAIKLANAWNPGVNLACGEFNDAWNLNLILNKDYTYPTHAEIDYYASKHFNLVRVPFMMTRVVTLATWKVREADMAVLVDLVAYAATKGITVLLDNHMYGAALNGNGTMPSDPTTMAIYAASWGMVAARFKSFANVCFGLMNEPFNITPSDAVAAHTFAIKAIRNVGCGQPVFVSGTYWDGAWSWVDNGNGAAFAPAVLDPIDNTVIEAHQYLDSGHSGDPNSPPVSGYGATALTPFTNWLRANGKKGFIGEFGFTKTAAFLTEGKALLKHMSDNRDVYVGFAYWSGGPWWGEYPFTCEPLSGVDRPQMAVLTQFVT
jgi:endoglucanase